MEKENSEGLSILFFGLGSIGKKHAKIIKDNFKFELFAYRTNKGQEKNDLEIKEFTSIEDAFSTDPDIAFITNPTYLHVETALDCVNRDIDIFIEKPISHNLENIDKLENEIKKRNIFSYVSYNLRFHPVINNLKEITKNLEKPEGFKVKCSSYLPNWRPKQDYPSSYSSKKELGGGVVLDVSHEFDYISNLFGEIKKIDGSCDKVSDLDIDCEDLVEAEITCKSNIKGSLHIDCFSRKDERTIMINYADKTIEGNLLINTIKIIDKGKEKIHRFSGDINYTYKKQLEYFFTNYINRNYKLMNNFSEASKTFKKIINFKEEKCLI